jgi:single-stranded DNA-binding protein
MHSGSDDDDHVERSQNLVVQSGTLVDEPRVITMKNNKECLTFTMKVPEHFILSDGTPGVHENFFTYEVMGRNVDVYLRELQVGHRYHITGYLRADGRSGKDKVCIRCYNIQTAKVRVGHR